MGVQLYIRPRYRNPRKPRAHGYLKPKRPALDLTDPINANLRALLWFGDKWAGDLTMMGPFQEFLNGVNTCTLDSFAVTDIVANDRGGSALQFGTGNRGVDLARGYFGDLNAGPWSVVTRFKVTSMAADGYVLYEAASGHNAFALAVKSTGAFQINIADNTNVASATTISTGIWYTITITYDAANYFIYIDDVLDKTAAKTTTQTGSIADTQVGRTSAGANQFNGVIDYVRWFKGPMLNLEQVRLLCSEPYAGVLDASPWDRIGIASAREYSGSITLGALTLSGAINVAVSGNITEAISATDAVSSAVVYGVAISETLTATDTFPPGGTYDMTLSDALDADTAQATTMTGASAMAEAGTATDTVHSTLWNPNAQGNNTWSANTQGNSTWTENTDTSNTWTEN